MTTAYNPETETEADGFDQFDMPNPDAKNRAGGLLPRVVFVSAHPDYDGTPIGGGGFMIVERDGQNAPDGWGEEISLRDGSTAKVSATLDCAVIGASAQTRRYIVNAQNEKGEDVNAGHVDIESKWWREEGSASGQYMDAKGKAPKSRISLFVVMKEDPSQVWELGLKSGNANVVRNLNDLLINLAALQTKRLKKEGRYNGTNDLMQFINWVTLTSGARMAYSSRNPGEDAGGFSRISIAWPHIPNLKQFQRQFVQKDEFGEKVLHWKEWGEAKKGITEMHLSNMFTGLANYKTFVAMREDLDDKLMQGYIMPLAGFEAIDTAIEEVKRRFFERSIAINTNQLPAPDDGPRDRDEWEDKKRQAAEQQAQAPEPAAEEPAPAAPTKPAAKATPWAASVLKERIEGLMTGAANSWTQAQIAGGHRDASMQAGLRGLEVTEYSARSIDNMRAILEVCFSNDVKWPMAVISDKVAEAKANSKGWKPEQLKAAFNDAMNQAYCRFGFDFSATGIKQDAKGVVAILMMCANSDEINVPVGEQVPF